MYQDTPGLIRKNYLADLEQYRAGGVYCFDTMENAARWFDDERIAWITKRYSKPDIQFFENPVMVDNDKGEIIQ
jgi:antibiotic biosynthesis monooxygenase (ABM) superfamily enzyme